MILFLFLLLISISFPQTIQHNPIESSFSNQSINFNIFIDTNNKEVNKVSLMYKNINQSEYLNKNMTLIGNNSFRCILEDHFYNKLDIEYYFIVEFKNGGMISKPIGSSYLINIIEYKDDYWENLSTNEQAELLILSPLPGSIIYKEDVMIAASMFAMNHVDTDNINILIDGKNITDRALITDKFLSISSLDLSVGDHEIIIDITSKFGMKYSPFKWNFTIKDDNKKSWFNENINQSLRYWSSYSNSNIGQNELEYYDHNLIYDVDLSWLKINSNIKISSLDNIYEQSKDRYSLTLENKNVKLYLGDFYPYFNTYILNGSRVRGFNLHSEYKFLSIDLIKGELQRAVQGNPYDNSLYLSEIDTINHIVTINRNNYAFKRELTALKLGIRFTEKILWNLNLFKAKDNISSVYSLTPSAQLEIDNQYIEDFNNSYLTDTINDNTYIMSYKDFVLSYDNFLYNIDSINYLNNNWAGDKPQDNFIIGSEILFNLDEGKTQIHSEINLSMLNENLWESITNSMQLDTFGGDSLDGKFMGTIEIPEDIFKYSDIFQLGFNQVPISPIDLTSDNRFNALLNMPSVIYEFDSKFNYGNHSVKYLYEKVGPQFNSLGNLYTQSNILKKSLSDRIRLFENRLYIYIDYTQKNEGIDLVKDHMIKTNISTFNLSLYPGTNLPNINIGFSNQDRFNDIPEAYFSEDGMVVDNREHTYSSNYNFSISDKILLIKEHDMNFSMFISDKKDMLLDKKISLDSKYYSPRSHNENYSINILTGLNKSWSSNLSYNLSNFNNGNDNIDSLNYYQEQKITSLDLSLNYSGVYFLDKFKLGFNSINGEGYQDFIYYNFKLSANHKLFNSIKIAWNYNYQIKWIKNDNMYKDSIFKMKLIYTL